MTIDYSEVLSEISKNSYNVRDDLKYLSVPEIKKIQEDSANPWHIMCLNITGDLNVGVIARAASALSAEHMYCVGRKRHPDRRSFVGTENYFPLERIEAIVDDIEINPEVVKDILISRNLVPVFVEQGGLMLGTLSWSNQFKPIFDNGKKPCLILGNEGMGISQDILDLADELEGFIVSIPMRGVTRSFNVASAASMIMFDMCKEMSWL